MNVILRQNVERLGAKGQTLRVKDGYARNFLLPRGIAVPATADMVQRMATEQAAMHSRQAKERAHLEQIKARIGAKAITIPMAAGPDDKLFGSVTNAHIAAALQQEGFDIDKRKIGIAEPIAALGTYTVLVRLHADVIATANISVVKQ